jgi:diadenosine tetraphosphate (Ap4A) HIT family hydrolase
MSGGTGACMACGLMTGAVHLPGGTILRTATWIVEHCVGPLGLGTLVVKPIRHVVHVADLTADESAELGPLLTRVSRAVGSLLSPEQVYVCLWSHSGAVPGHIHFVVQPATAEAMAEYGVYGPALQVAMFDDGHLPDETRVAELCDRLRVELDGGAGPAAS